MSFLRHRKSIVRFLEDGAARPLRPSHRLDEFPPGYSLASCTPAWLASASPGEVNMNHFPFVCYSSAANGNVSLFILSHDRGSLQSVPNFSVPNFSSRRR